MGVRGRWLGVAAWALLMAAPGAAQGDMTAAGTAARAAVSPPVSGTAVLIAPVQGSDALGASYGEPVSNAVRDALRSRGHQVTAVQEPWGQALVDCQTPECIEHALDAADAAFAVVPAVWSRERGGAELTLTLVQRSGRSLNVSAPFGADVSRTATALVDMLLARQAAAGPDVRPDATASETPHPHAWKAGPILLIAGGSAAFVAIGVAAGIKDDGQQLDGAAVGAWSAVGAAAVAGGIAWWVVGKKRRRSENSLHGARGVTVGFQPTRIDLRLRF